MSSFPAQLRQQELEDIFTKVEDSRHLVSQRVLQHYKSLKSGENPEATHPENTRKPLDGDWYLDLRTD